MNKILSIILVIVTLCACNPPAHNFNFAVVAFPNPCVDEVFIQVSPDVEVPFNSVRSFKVIVVDAKNGDNIANLSFNDQNMQSLIDMRDYDPGQYYLNLYFQGELVTSDVFLKVDEE